MRRLFGIIGMLVVGWLCWWAGALINLPVGLMTSIVGSGVGLYLGRRVHRRYF